MEDPESLWAFGAVEAVLLAAGGGTAAHTRVGPDGLYRDDGGGNWWKLAWVAGGHAVVTGNDHEYSDTSGYDHTPPLDLLAGAPGWVPAEWLLEARRANGHLGFVHWWDGRRWDRSPYPDSVRNDGHRIVGCEEDSLHYALFEDRAPDETWPALDGLLARVHDRSLDEASLGAFLDLAGPGPYTLPEALATAALAGVVPGSERPELPPGTADRPVLTPRP